VQDRAESGDGIAERGRSRCPESCLEVFRLLHEGRQVVVLVALFPRAVVLQADGISCRGAPRLE